MPMSDRDRIAEVLSEHFPDKVSRIKGNRLTSVCNCGADVPVSDVRRISDSYAAHRADMLIAAGCQMPATRCPEWVRFGGKLINCQGAEGHEGGCW